MLELWTREIGQGSHRVGQHQGATGSQLSNAALQTPPQANMSAALELLWLLWLVSGLSLLLLLGATAWLCVHCSRPGRCHTGRK